MPFLGVYDWSMFNIPSGIPENDLLGDTHANDPNSVDYSSSATTWIGQTFTFNGGSPTGVYVNDDDGQFEDYYVESGSAQTLAQDTTINGVTYSAGSVIENEFSMLDSSGNEIFVVRIDGVNVGFTYPTGQEPSPGQTFTASSGRDGAASDSGDGVSSTEPYSGVICFAKGTRIRMPGGTCPVEDLQIGQYVLTMDRGPEPILWLGSTTLEKSDLRQDDKPVLISQGSLGPGVPNRDLIVSPQHRILLKGSIVQKMFGHSEVLVPAKGLLGMRRIRKMAGRRSVTYFHVLLARHSIIEAEGAATESFFPGPEAMKMLTPEQRREVSALYPKINLYAKAKVLPLARPALTVRETEHLVERARMDAKAGATGKMSSDFGRAIGPGVTLH